MKLNFIGQPRSVHSQKVDVVNVWRVIPLEVSLSDVLISPFDKLN